MAEPAKLSDRVVSFLSAGTRTGMLGYVAADGRPLVAPVWFVVDRDQEGAQLVFNTGRDTSKGRALARDSRVVICVDDPQPPYSFVQVQGLASISDEPGDVLDVATRTGARYMGADRADEFGRRNSVPGELVVRVRPTKVVAGFDISD
jgi:PPOX class probable F420-dependent enzyme